MNELDALRFVDFEWAVRFNEVWRAPAVDVPDLHARLRAEFARKLDVMERNNGESSPLGWVVAGSGGTGKTHLLGAFRREATSRGVPFIMVDMTDVHDFWECVLQGYVDSLQVEVDGGPPQYKRTLVNIIERLGLNSPVAEILATLSHRKSRNQRDDANRVLSILHKAWPRETMKFQNVIRALVCINSDDFTYTNIGQAWLQGVELEDDQRRELGFTVRGERPHKIVEALSWMLSLGGPTVLAFDQLDASIEQLHNQKLGPDDDDRTTTARAILAKLGGGLGALRDVTRNTLAVVSCVESTWAHLRGVVLGTAIDRFEAPHRLRVEHKDDIARALVEGRLAVAHRQSGFAPPYPTYPFRPEAFGAFNGASPREILKHCGAHVQTCLLDGKVSEWTGPASKGAPVTPQPVIAKGLERLDAEFQRLRSEADPAWLLEERHDDDRLAPLILSGLGCLVAERDLGPNVSAMIDAELTGGAKTRPLHARLRLIHHDQNEREEHFSVRAIQWTNDRAFQSRLKAALTQSGIDRNLNFRRLTVIRSFPNPNGPASKRLLADFERHGGALAAPSEDDIRTLGALHQLKTRKDADLTRWLKDRRPASALGLIQTIVGRHPLLSGEPAQAPPTKGETKPIKEQKPPSHNSNGKSGPATTGEHTPPPSPDVRIPLGRKLQSGTPRETVELPIKLLDKHALILAGSGSGKTVLLKRLIEEAALAGVPSIVIDHANDLATLGEPWPAPPGNWTDDDHRKAEAFHATRRVVVWTPGKSAGNPLTLEPVPDLSPVVGDAEELEGAALMTVAALAPQAAPGRSKANNHKVAILKTAIIYMAEHGGGRLDELINLLSDLPPEAGPNLGKEAKLAKEMADDLKAAIVMDPLLRSNGTPIDPAILFGLNQGPESPARVSVVSLVGLPTLESRRHFVNQLAMALFTWIRKNPAPAGRPLRGLLVIDEAKDFIPSQRASTCADSLMRLGAQARKYGLGLLFATQNPKDIDNKLVANCSTQFYGKMNSPAAQSAARELLRSKSGSGDDIGNLPTGHFYYHNADAGLIRPLKLQTSLCLSRHGGATLDEPAILAKAAASRPTTQSIVN